MQTFLVLGAIFGFIGVALGAFGSHALRSKLTSERVATFETGVRYQMWHALALFVVVVVEAWTPTAGSGPSSFTLVGDRGGAPFHSRQGGCSAGPSCSRAVCTRSR
jgi:uncharacterized membrane protein YgdD (TMEM256/DUF423 family)